MAYNFGNPYSMPNYPAYNAAAYPYTATPQITPQVQNQQNTSAQGEPLNNGGFIVLPSEEDIKKYPVAPGNLVTFKIENKPVIIEKSMGRSPFDAPHYERYKLIREEMEEEKPEPAKSEPDELEAIKNELETLKGNYKELKESFSEFKRSYRKNSPQRKTNSKNEGKGDSLE